MLDYFRALGRFHFLVEGMVLSIPFTDSASRPFDGLVGQSVEDSGGQLSSDEFLGGNIVSALLRCEIWSVRKVLSICQKS